MRRTISFYRGNRWSTQIHSLRAQLLAPIGYEVLSWLCDRDLGPWLGAVFTPNCIQQVITKIAPPFQHKLFKSSLLQSDWLMPITKIKPPL